MDPIGARKDDPVIGGYPVDGLIERLPGGGRDDLAGWEFNDLRAHLA